MEFPVDILLKRRIAMSEAKAITGCLSIHNIYSTSDAVKKHVELTHRALGDNKQAHSSYSVLERPPGAFGVHKSPWGSHRLQGRKNYVFRI